MLKDDELALLRTSLFAGHYHLLLGSGISMDSTNGAGNSLKNAGVLAEELSVLKGLGVNTPLSRVSMTLNDSEIEKYITKPYSSCRAGETVKRLTSFIWKTAFTFNIDDALEAAYETTAHPKQQLESINFDENYKTPKDKSQLLAIHLHGFTRQSEKKYVFSSTEYARVTRGMNAWMHVLSELIASEPFIISGTSLNEPDLDYYLAGRTDASARTNRGPSILVEPYPDKLTEILCQRHGLILIKSKLADFLSWLTDNLGRPPSVGELTIPSIQGIFSAKVTPEKQLVFFSDFELVSRSAPNPEGDISPFHFGKTPRWSDLESLCDIPTKDEQRLGAKVRNWLTDGNSKAKLICLLAEAGSGKTTILRRTAYELCKEGQIVFLLSANAAIDAENVVQVLSEINHPVTIVVDGLAAHTPSLRTIMTQLVAKKPVMFISADRDYRRNHIDRVIGDLNVDYEKVDNWDEDRYELLIEKLFRLGLLAQYESVHYPKKFALDLVDDTVAIATCRALNNFKPLETILRSVWRDSSADEKRSYAIAALAEHCYDGGIFYPVLEKAHPNNNLRNQLKLACPLPLTYADDSDYVYALHAVVADRLLMMLARDKSEWLLEIFSSLANALAPHVNRKTTISRTPEARLAARLFSSEKVVRPLLGSYADIFYEKSQPAWKWNPRYWEQRALLTQTSNIDLAIQYARHAVAIEEHPFPWTTLASLLVKKLDSIQSGHASIFAEVVDLLQLVIRHEKTSKAWRPTPHPYTVLFHAVSIFLNFDGQLSPKVAEWLSQQIEYCNNTFDRDKALISNINKIVQRLKKSN
jgi:hypothetical protein